MITVTGTKALPFGTEVLLAFEPTFLVTLTFPNPESFQFSEKLNCVCCRTPNCNKITFPSINHQNSKKPRNYETFYYYIIFAINLLSCEH